VKTGISPSVRHGCAAYNLINPHHHTRDHTHESDLLLGATHQEEEACDCSSHGRKNLYS
jgi:hypothetical protein